MDSWITSQRLQCFSSSSLVSSNTSFRDFFVIELLFNRQLVSGELFDVHCLVSLQLVCLDGRLSAGVFEVRLF